MARPAVEYDGPDTVLTGRPGSPGVGFGRALLVEPAAAPPSATRAVVGGPADPVVEKERLQVALEGAAAELEDLATETAARAGEDIGAIFEAQALFARDPGIVEPALAEVSSGVPAADAILAVTERFADGLAAVDDAYFRERAADVRDVGRRVAARIRGERPPDMWHTDGHPAIVIAADLEPSAIATVRRDLVAGIALGGGAPTGHAAIVARALGIPMVLGLGEAIESIPARADVAIDGSAGVVWIDPDASTISSLRVSPVGAERPDAPKLRVASGVDVAVCANVASALEAEAAAAADADGIGLVRTELLFLGRHAAPSVEEQRTAYRRIRAAAGERPTVFRTLDVGGDKPASWQTGPAEANPALGVRGARLAQRQPELLDAQLRALVEAAGDGDLHVMFPMVAVREELDAMRARLTAIVEDVASATGTRPERVSVGVMIEVPSAAVMADALAESADFFSIGTNDLVQYTMAADRTNPELVELASPLQPAVLRLIDGVVRAAHGRGRPVTVCGEAAAEPTVIPILVGLGVDELSVASGSIGAVRQRLAALDREECVALAARALAVGTLGDVRALVEE
jgi:phosphoenolpyruvate-protein phosphotransferase